MIIPRLMDWKKPKLYCSNTIQSCVVVNEHKVVEDGSVTDIASVAQEWKRLARPYPPLIVRVLSRSRLRHYGKPHKTDKWPYQVQKQIH